MENKYLSRSSRIILAMSVLNTLPIFQMQTVKLPVSICNEMDKITRKWIWGGAKDIRKIYLLRWGTLCKPVKLGGASLRSAEAMNKSLLAKLVWRLIVKLEATWCNLLRAKYGGARTEETLFEAQCNQCDHTRPR